MKRYFGIFALVISLMLAIIYIKVYMLSANKNFEDVGLGVGTIKYLPVKNGFPIHIDSIGALPYLDSGFSKNGAGKAIVLWLGNSQLHGVNQYKEGDQNSLEYLHDSLLQRGKYTVAFSLPNANLQEHYVLLKYLGSRLKIDQLIIPVFFDDTRESGLRSDLLREEIKVAVDSGKDTSMLGISLTEAFKPLAVAASENADMKALHATTQERVEKYLNNKMNSVSKIWDSRADLRSMVIYDYLFKFRNFAFNISPNTKRRMIPLRYDLNMEALAAICSYCNEKGIRLLMYIPPIRDDAEQPYVKEEYEHFKNDIGIYNEKFGFSLLVSENVVPAKYWGLKLSTSMGEEKMEIDFMHFQDPGHKRLADTIYRKLNTEMK
jgi:hypothetical protein